MSQPSHQAGQEVARILRALIEGTTQKPVQELWEATLVPRASVSPPMGKEIE
jgi:DNA-binding LacI/PurR family transcriptional regulator